MKLIEQRILCSVCTSDQNIVSVKHLSKLDKSFFTFLKHYNLLNICKDCLNTSYSLFNGNRANFIDWLDENDNRVDIDVEELNRLRQEFNITDILLEENPDQYLDNLEKYVVCLENRIITDNASF